MSASSATNTLQGFTGCGNIQMQNKI